MGGKAVNSMVISIRVPNDVGEIVKARASELGTTVTAIGLDLLRAYAERTKPTAMPSAPIGSLLKSGKAGGKR